MAQSWLSPGCVSDLGSQLHLGWACRHEFSYVQGGRLPCGGWLGAEPVDKTILRACMVSGTPLRLSTAR